MSRAVDNTEVLDATANLGLPWTLKEGQQHPWHVECESNIPGIRGLVAIISYRPMAELVIAAANAYSANQKEIARLRASLEIIADRGERTTLVQDRSVRIIKQLCASLAVEARDALTPKEQP